eukprot:4387145-Amphidinium_carterae.1
MMSSPLISRAAASAHLSCTPGASPQIGRPGAQKPPQPLSTYGHHHTQRGSGQKPCKHWGCRNICALARPNLHHCGKAGNVEREQQVKFKT